jgi:two-component system response regulator FixJ
VNTCGYDAHVFSSAIEFLSTTLPGADSCLIIDIAMPEMDGLALQAELARRMCKTPIIFITALSDPDLRERAKRAGASAFFQKPVDADALCDAINWAVTGNQE